MRHCVVTYLDRCVRGESSIWSLTCERDGRLFRCATVELSRDNEIVQCRGFANCMQSETVRAVIARWVRQHGLGDWAQITVLNAA
jgi:hypothetical protein